MWFYCVRSISMSMDFQDYLPRSSSDADTDLSVTA